MYRTVGSLVCGSSVEGIGAVLRDQSSDRTCAIGAPGEHVESAFHPIPIHGLQHEDCAIAQAAGKRRSEDISSRIKGNGTIFMLQPMNGNWVESTLHMFTGSTDGASPVGRTHSEDGTDTFYGLQRTNQGAHCPVHIDTGTCVGAGTTFQFTYSASGTSYAVIYEFPFGGDLNAGPQDSLAMDAAGNLFGTARLNGLLNTGSVFELTPNGQNWTGTLLYSFSYFGPDGSYPYSNIVMDANGKLYGTAQAGGSGNCLYPSGGCGTVYQIRGR